MKSLSLSVAGLLGLAATQTAAAPAQLADAAAESHAYNPFSNNSLSSNNANGYSASLYFTNWWV